MSLKYLHIATAIVIKECYLKSRITVTITVSKKKLLWCKNCCEQFKTFKTIACISSGDQLMHSEETKLARAYTLFIFVKISTIKCIFILTVVL